mmetsp:Transcript_95004/g.307365  ORF Transcript_95004/g.307365 Transcript_95004/m.307365 type:complete len:358 (+) Transcript_95004:1114-2187(+)
MRSCKRSFAAFRFFGATPTFMASWIASSSRRLPLQPAPLEASSNSASAASRCTWSCRRRWSSRSACSVPAPQRRPEAMASCSRSKSASALKGLAKALRMQRSASLRSSSAPKLRSSKPCAVPTMSGSHSHLSACSSSSFNSSTFSVSLSSASFRKASGQRFSAILKMSWSFASTWKRGPNVISIRASLFCNFCMASSGTFLCLAPSTAFFASSKSSMVGSLGSNSSKVATAFSSALLAKASILLLGSFASFAGARDGEDLASSSQGPLILAKTQGGTTRLKFRAWSVSCCNRLLSQDKSAAAASNSVSSHFWCCSSCAFLKTLSSISHRVFCAAGPSISGLSRTNSSCSLSSCTSSV